jgi:hypothetical protein
MHAGMKQREKEKHHEHSEHTGEQKTITAHVAQYLQHCVHRCECLVLLPAVKYVTILLLVRAGVGA